MAVDLVWKEKEVSKMGVDLVCSIYIKTRPRRCAPVPWLFSLKIRQYIVVISRCYVENSRHYVSQLASNLRVIHASKKWSVCPPVKLFPK